jgi:hypothetical protein
MPSACSSGTYRFTAPASTMNSTSVMPVGATIVGVVPVTTPISATRVPSGVAKTWMGGSIGSPVPASRTSAAR